MLGALLDTQEMGSLDQLLVVCQQTGKILVGDAVCQNFVDESPVVHLQQSQTWYRKGVVVDYNMVALAAWFALKVVAL